MAATRGSASTIKEHLRWSSRCREHFFPWRSRAAESLQDSGIAEAGISDLYPGYSLGRVNPRFHLLVYTTHGRGLVKGVSKHFVVGNGEVIVVPAHTPFTKGPFKSRWRYLWIHLYADKRWSMLDGMPIHVRRTVLTEQLDHAMAGFLKEYRSRRFSAERMVALYSEAITICVLRDHGTEEIHADASIQTKLEELWQAVYSNLMHPWSTAELARIVGVSVPHLHRLVVKFNQTTPMRMVLRLRMAHAQELLIQDDSPLSIISERVGYRDQFAFAVAFKRFAGVTPGQFRNRR